MYYQQKMGFYCTGDESSDAIVPMKSHRVFHLKATLTTAVFVSVKKAKAVPLHAT
jgi:hypothetical protein